jgi:hypothetical protein
MTFSEDDLRLLALLADLLERVDPVPQAVVEAALAARDALRPDEP